MPTRFSEALGVTTQDLWREGAFDAFVDIDARFHIDPHLLQKTGIPELQNSYKRFKKHFENVLRLLEASKQPGDIFYQQAAKNLEFPEFPFVSLGHGNSRSGGNGIGPKLAQEITDTAVEIIEAGVNDPIIFELVGVLQKGIGADRISDMAIQIIVEDLLAYSERVAKNLSVKTISREHKDRIFHVPLDLTEHQPVILVPHEILRPLPIALDWDGVDAVCAYNSRLRNALNETIGLTWRDVTKKKLKKEEIKALLLNNPELLQNFVRRYKEKPPERYDFKRDPDGIIIWYDLAQEWAQKFPELLADVPFITPEQIHGVVMRICKHYGRLLEHHGMNALLYNDEDKLRRERFARLLFFGIADTYCKANNLGLNLVKDGGRELVAFKIGRGYENQVNVTVKYTRNSNLVQHYETAVANCQDQGDEHKEELVFLVIRTAESRDVLAALDEIKEQAKVEKMPTPELLIVDGRFTDATYGSLWEFGEDFGFEFEPFQDIDLPNLDDPNPVSSNGKQETIEEPIGIRAKRLGIRVKRLRRWDNILVHLRNGLTQAMMAEMEDVAVRTIKVDVRDMKEKGIYPMN